MTDKLELKSCHEVIDTVDVANIESIFHGKPTDPDILTVVMKDGRRLYCDEICPIDSLQEEPVSDKLEEAAWLYYDKNRLPIPPEWNLHKEFIDFFKAGAQWGKNQTKVEIQAQSMALAHGCPKEPVSEPNEQLAETYLAMFDKKFPILPTLKGKQLADYKNFLNKCQQIFGLKEWGIHPIQSKVFEKLTLLWATWGAEHLQGVGKYDEEEVDEEHISDALSAEIEEIWGRHSFFNFDLMQNVASLSKKEITEIAHHFTNWQKEHLWKPADGDELPIIDREVIALLDNGKVVFAHRPPEFWDGKNIVTGKVTRNYPKTYDKGGWNIPNVKWWLDCNMDSIFKRNNENSKINKR